MVRHFAAMVGLMLGLAVPTALQAQAPYEYPSRDQRWVPPLSDRAQDLIAREEAEAVQAEAACDAGDLSGCVTLGTAYRDGTGRPQNRPVAEVLYRQACEGGAGAGCVMLGDQLLKLDNDTAVAEGKRALERGCTLGTQEACDRLAQIAADARAAVEDQRLLETQCTAGNLESCTLLIGRFASEEEELPRSIADALGAGCQAGSAFACHRLGRSVFVQGSGPAEQRTAALALFDRACALEGQFCDIGRAISDRPVLAARCAEGVMADCAALGEIHAREGPVLYSPAEALMLLGKACEGGEASACSGAAGIALQMPAMGTPEQAEQWYALGCEGGDYLDCILLADRLTEEDRLPEDRARGYALMVKECENGGLAMCDELYKRAGADPEAPLIYADERFVPPTEQDDPEAEARRLAQVLAIEAANDAYDPCTQTLVTFRGVTYRDTVCETTQRVIGGYQLRPGQAPWQALLWSPPRDGRRLLRPGQRVVCGGALIAPGWILTAAHCLVDKNKKLKVGRDHRIRLGVYNPRADEGVSYPILGIAVHPNYHEPSRAFDIALMRFDRRSGTTGAATNAIAPIRIDPFSLDQRPIRKGMQVYTYGWGRTSVNGDTADHLRGALMQLEDPDACARRTEFIGDFLGGAVLCAGARDGSQACHGDSGGPLITYGDARKVATVIGVVSAGTECGTTGEPSRYTRVAKVGGWIDDVMDGRVALRVP